MAAQTTFVNNLLSAAFRGATYTGNTIRMGLFKTGMPSTTGVEVSGGSYARQILTYALPSSKSIATSSDAVFTNLPTGAINTIVAWGVYDNTTLIDEGTLTTPFTPDVTNNELKMNHVFNLNA